jgi:hypothetical protein
MVGWLARDKATGPGSRRWRAPWSRASTAGADTTLALLGGCKCSRGSDPPQLARAPRNASGRADIGMLVGGRVGDAGAVDVTVSSRRFRDPGVLAYELPADDIDVVCPRCGERAVVTAEPVEGLAVMGWPRRFVCGGCVWSVSWSAREGYWRLGRAVDSLGRAVDPFFGFALWYQAVCCGGRTLWALHDAHLALLEGYVAAGLRERSLPRPKKTMVDRLPVWLKAAKNRDEVLRVLARLRASGGAAVR